MKLPVGLIAFCTATAVLCASESQTQLLVQPILAHGGAESWGSPDVEFRIVDVPFLNWSHQGKPAYRAIAQPNQILTNAPRDVRLPESNLLAFYGITIGGGSGELWLRLESAQAVKGWQTTIEAAAYAALECIRIVADRYHDHPKVRISAPKGEEQKWSEVEKRFSTHDFSKPFTRPNQAMP